MVYCHDLPGLLAFKKLIEEVEDPEKLLNVVSQDDGKGIFKMVLNWSKVERDKKKVKLMGPKKAIVLAAVAKVPETYHNMWVLMELTKPHEVECILSQDLKLANIMAGIQTHSAKYPCVYGECTRNETTGQWTKGQYRTTQNMLENRKRWLQSGGSRDQLKNHKNCEHEPLLSAINPKTPIMVQLPPPPLHTILLGKVSRISCFQ